MSELATDVIEHTSSPTGRGLFVVRALVDDVRVVETDQAHAVRCRRRLGGS